MIESFHYIIIALFTLGGILISIINKNKESDEKKKNWIKFISYFFIVNLVIYSIITNVLYFYYLAICISFLCLFEISKAINKSKKLFIGILFIFTYIPLVYGFVQFATLRQEIILFTYLVVITFDAFSQLTGQLFGKTAFVPNISPNKTLEGLIGGIVSTVIISILYIPLLEMPYVKSFILTIVISFFAFLGDLLASYIKRTFKIKDFSKLLPGQGGVLDRFDSFILAGTIISILSFFNFI